jgi:hypothetical protein
MIFPRGEVVHRNLSTAYTDFPALLSTLKSGDFSGIIEIEFPESKGTIFVESGESLNAEAKIGADSKRMIGQEAIQTLMTLSHQKDGVITSTDYPPNEWPLWPATFNTRSSSKGSPQISPVWIDFC